MVEALEVLVGVAEAALLAQALQMVEQLPVEGHKEERTDSPFFIEAAHAEALVVAKVSPHDPAVVEQALARGRPRAPAVRGGGGRLDDLDRRVVGELHPHLVERVVCGAGVSTLAIPLPRIVGGGTTIVGGRY